MAAREEVPVYGGVFGLGTVRSGSLTSTACRPGCRVACCGKAIGKEMEDEMGTGLTVLNRGCIGDHLKAF